MTMLTVLRCDKGGWLHLGGRGGGGVKSDNVYGAQVRSQSCFAQLLKQGQV
jgi:hypothetical protein